jgi:hypothetical protein
VNRVVVDMLGITNDEIEKQRHKSQIPVIEQALETAALMLVSDRSRGYCLEMICAVYFLAGASLDDSGDPDVLVRALITSLKFLSQDQRQAFLTSLNGQATLLTSRRQSGLRRKATGNFASRYCGAMAGADSSTTKHSAACQEKIQSRT